MQISIPRLVALAIALPWCALAQVNGALQGRQSSDSSNALLLNGRKGDPGVYPGSYGGGMTGWRFMPDITSLAGATLDTTSLTVGTQGAVLTHYITANYTASKIKRAIIIIHGQDRPSWNMQIYATKALQRAVQGGTVKEDEVVIMAPQFFNTDDYGAYPVDALNMSTTSQMVWGTRASNGWGGGEVSRLPLSSSVGSFDALDSALAFFHDRKRFPALTTVVLAGFSMGAQLVQRYSVFRSDTSQDSRIRFWVSSPASYVYLNSSRPAQTSDISSCSKYNDYKYGLEGQLPAYLLTGPGRLNGSSSAALQQRYTSRTLNFLVGLDDGVQSDRSCSAALQGSGHVSRMYNWINFVIPYLSGARGRLPTNCSVDYVVKARHNPFEIINSDPGVQRLFLDSYNGAGNDAGAPLSNGYSSGTPSSHQLSGSSNDSNSIERPSFATLASLILAIGFATSLL